MTLPFPLLNASPYDESTIFSARNFDAGNPGMRNPDRPSVDGVFAFTSVWFTIMENVPLPMYGTLAKAGGVMRRQRIKATVVHVLFFWWWHEAKEEKKRNQIYQISHIFFSQILIK